MRPIFSTSAIPAYHEGMLLVDMQPTPAGGVGIAAAAGLGVRGAVPTTTGMAALSFYERAGLIRRLVPVTRPSDERPSAPRVGIAARMMAAGAVSSEESRAPGAGLHLVEVERNEDVPQLQIALASDPNVASVSRVPVRYLVARGTRGRGHGKASIGDRDPEAGGGLGALAAPPPPGTMWNLRKVRWAEARATEGFIDADSVSVAVLDTGIDESHPDLQGRVQSYTFAHPDLPDASSNQDIIGHGTHVAGTIAAGIENGLGINGICRCSLRIWKIFDDVPDLVTSGNQGVFVYFVDPVMYLRALLDCVDASVDVVNLSIGGPGRPSAAERDAFEALIANGTTVVAAMGNEREEGSPTSYPAAIPGVIAVGAIGINDRVTTFSNRGNHIAVCAPGEAIWSTLPTYPGQLEWEAVRGPDGRWRQGKPRRRQTDYDAWPGTSMASPHVAAAVALLKANRPGLSARDVREALEATMDKVLGMGGAAWHPDYGHGRLNLERLIRYALTRDAGAPTS
jgi:subtilisin family serine protease